MRIITGSAKGTKLFAPKGLKVRPTADRVKESVFNILGGFIVGTSVLDLFAGTGNLGLEALSRGANFAIFVDNDENSVRIIKKNIVATKFLQQATVVRMEAIKIIERYYKEGQFFDLIFCDPPYNRGLYTEILQQVSKYNLLKPNGCLVFEHSKHEESDCPDGLAVFRVQQYGETMVTFIQKHT